MKKKYIRKALLVDDGFILDGYTSKRKFYPNGFDAGFSYQKFRKKDIGKIILYGNDVVDRMNEDKRL